MERLNVINCYNSLIDDLEIELTLQVARLTRSLSEMVETIGVAIEQIRTFHHNCMLKQEPVG